MFWIFKYDIKSLFNKRLVIMLVCIMCVGGALLYFSQDQMEEQADDVSDSIKIGVADLDQSIYSKMMLTFFEESDAFSDYIDLIYEEEVDTLKELIDQDEIDLYIIVPEGIVQSVVRIDNTPVHVMINQKDVNKAVLIRNLLHAYEKYIEAVQLNCVVLYDVMDRDMLSDQEINAANMEISLELVSTALNKNKIFKRVQLDEAVGIPLAQYYGYELLYLFIAYTSMAYGLKVMKDQQSGIMRRLFTTGMNPVNYFFSKQFFVFPVYATVFLSAFLVRFLMSGIFYYQSLLLCILVAVLFSTFFIMIGSFFSSMKSYLLASNLFIIFSIILGAGIIPLMYLPQSMVRIAQYTPNYWFVFQTYLIEQERNLIQVLIIGVCTIVLSVVCSMIACACYTRKEAALSDV